MAKLHARNRKEILRMEKESDKANDLTSWHRHTIALMDDGTLLEKRDVRFLPTTYDPKGRYHSYGWKRVGKPVLTVSEICKKLTAKGYKVVVNNEDPE